MWMQMFLKHCHNLGAKFSSGSSEVLMGPPLEANARVHRAGMPERCPA